MRQVYIYLVLDTERISQDEYIFMEVHSKQEEGWQLEGAAIAI